MSLLVLLVSVLVSQAPPPRPAPFVTPHTPAEMKGKQAVIETTGGTLLIGLLADAAPDQVGCFIGLAREGACDGTTFHRMVRGGIIQGGDPISKDPAKRDLSGTGGLGVLRAEPGAETHTRGAGSSVILPGRPDSGGAQFFVCVGDQPALGGQHTVFARVVDGMATVEAIEGVRVEGEKPKTPVQVVRARVTRTDR